MNTLSHCIARRRRILVTAPILALMFSALAFFWLTPAVVQAAGEPCHAMPRPTTGQPRLSNK